MPYKPSANHHVLSQRRQTAGRPGIVQTLADAELSGGDPTTFHLPQKGALPGTKPAMAPQQQQKVEHPPSTICARVKRFLPKKEAVRRNGSCLVAWLPSQWCRAGPCSQRCRPNTPQNGRLQWATRCTTCPEPCSPWQYDAKVYAFRGPPRNFAGQFRVCPLRLRPWLIERG